MNTLNFTAATAPLAIRWGGVLWKRDQVAGRRRKYYRFGKRFLHREIYRAIYGSLAPFAHVHHRDLNPFNNDPRNLEVLTLEAHLAQHALARASGTGASSPP